MNLAEPEFRTLYGGYLTAPEATSLPRWATLQARFLQALDRYVEAELERTPDFEIASHEAGGQCRIWFPHYRVRGNAQMLERMHAILDARLAWDQEHLFHGYVDCHEVHHEPETFLYFQAPFMHLTGEPKAVSSVEDFAHHVGNWAEGVPEWYDWEAHGFRSTWLGTREVRNFPPYDYQEANHFRFVAIGLAAYAGTGDARYLKVAEDYADRWCEHIEAFAARGEAIPCSILPEGARRQEMGYGGILKEAVGEGVYPVFYATVAQNTAYDIVTVLLDLFRLTDQDRYREAAGAMIAQFFDHANEAGRPASRFVVDAWEHAHLPEDPEADRLGVALGGSQGLVARMAEKYRVVTGETRFDRAVLRWAESVDETQNLQDQLQMPVLIAAHQITGEASYLERACEMALRGTAVTEANRMWHQCDSRGRYGFKYAVDSIYHPMLSGVDYATRGGLPVVGLAYETSGRPGLPKGVAVRTWEPSPERLVLEAVNGGDAPAAWQISAAGWGGDLEDLVSTEGESRLAREGEGWMVNLPAGECLRLEGRWEGRGKVQVKSKK